MFWYMGYTVIGGLGSFYIGAAIVCAAGTIFVMVIDTVVPKVFDDIHNWSGLIAAFGFLCGFALSHIL